MDAADKKSLVTTSLCEEETFMDLSAIGCSLMIDQQQQQNSGNNRYLCPQQPPPPYPSGLVAPTPYQTPYVSPYATPFHTPSPSPLSSVQSSPAGRTSVFNNPGIKSIPTFSQQQQQPGIDSELAMILECDPFIWDHQHQQQQPIQQPPPPPYPQDRVTGRPPHPRPTLQQPSRTQLKQQLQRQQLEQQERREREKAALHKSSRASSCQSGNNPPNSNNIPIVPVIDASVVSSLPPQVLKVRTRLESK